MAAEFDTQPNYTGQGDGTQDPAPEQQRDPRSSWATFGLFVLVAVIVLLLLAQCTARVPQTVGLSRSDAVKRVAAAGFKIGDISESAAGSGRPGFVQAQAPAAGMLAKKTTPIYLIVAAGADLVKVPDVCGQNIANASITLSQAGFETENAQEYSDTVPRGAVVRQSPTGGTRAQAGSTVVVYYSLGPHADAVVAAAPMDTNDGLTDENRDSTGSDQYPPMMTCTRAYPGATAWSSGGDIYVRLVPGGAARRVTSTADWDTDPIISPSHKYLVFLRASSSGKKPTGVGAVCFTNFSTHMLSQLPVNVPTAQPGTWYGKPVFAPSASSTTPNTDWIVYAQYWNELPYQLYWLAPAEVDTVQPAARLIVCNVPYDTKWVSWNIQFRPSKTLTIGRSSQPGCVYVRQTDGGKTLYSRNLDVSSQLYLR